MTVTSTFLGRQYVYFCTSRYNKTLSENINTEHSWRWSLTLDIVVTLDLISCTFDCLQTLALTRGVVLSLLLVPLSVVY